MKQRIGWVLYDGSCGFCRRWTHRWEKTLNRRGLEIAPLQADWVVQRIGLPEKELVKDIRLLLEDGTQIHGADVYRYVMRHIGWAYPLYLLSVCPVLREIFDWSYRSFAANRHRFSRACGINESETDTSGRNTTKTDRRPGPAPQESGSFKN